MGCKAGWLSDDDECSWWNDANDVFCTADGAALEFDLWRNNLIGTIPAELALLSNSLSEYIVHSIQVYSCQLFRIAHLILCLHSRLLLPSCR